jgi:hypothetical protein
MENPKIKFALLPRILTGVLIAFYILSMLNKNFNLIYANITLFTLGGFEIFRLLTGIFISENIVDLLFNIFILFTIINFTENKEGTAKTAIRLLCYILGLQLLTNIVIILLYLLHPIILSNMIKPLPAIGISFLIRNILLTDNKQIQIYNNIEFSNRLLCLFTFIVFLVINIHELKAELLVSLLFGFLVCKFKDIADYLIDEERIVLFEKNDTYKFLFSLDGYVLISSDLPVFAQAPQEEVKDDIEVIDVDI